MKMMKTHDFVFGDYEMVEDGGRRGEVAWLEKEEFVWGNVKGNICRGFQISISIVFKGF
jgi:hypothetical protein